MIGHEMLLPLGRVVGALLDPATSAAAKCRMPSRHITPGVISRSDGPNHALTCGFPPEGAHALASVASPALDKGSRSEVGAIDLTEFRLVQPDLRATVDLVAVIKHEAALVGMPEVFEVRDFDLITRLSYIEIIDQLFLVVEKDKVCPGFLLDGDQLIQEIAFFLTGTPSDIGGLVDKPRNPGFRPELLTKFVETDSGGMGKIRPPVIVWNLLELLPLDQRGASGNDDIFFLKVPLGTEYARENECEKQDQL